jgi:2-polyprenyl-3-methyl-5-hydroxy-6-metoxy-1,4-benzoquinol methylase
MMKTDKFYRRYGEYYKEPAGLKRLDFIAEHILERVREKRSAVSILDAGCGNGNISIAMGSLQNNRIIAIDPDTESIKKATHMNSFPNVSFLAGRLEDLTFSEKFDIVICSEVLEHLQQPAKMLNGIKQVLKADGTLLLTIPNGFAPLEIINQIQSKTRHGRFGKWIGTVKTKIKKNRNVGVQSSNIDTPHVQFFTLKRFKKMLYRSDIDVVSVHNSNSYLGFGVLWYLFLQVLIERGSKLFQRLDELDCAIADRLPHLFAAGWYLTCRLAKQNE